MRKRILTFDRESDAIQVQNVVQAIARSYPDRLLPSDSYPSDFRFTLEVNTEDHTIGLWDNGYPDSGEVPNER